MNTNLSNDDFDLPYIFGDLNTINSIWLTLTNKCNIHCKYCFNYIYRNYEDMPSNLSIKIVKNHIKTLHDANVNELNVIYFGGEPTVNTEALLDSIDYIQSQNIHSSLHILTNGIVNSTVLEKLLTRDVVYQISLDGKKNNVRYYKNSIKNADEQTLKFIKKIHEHDAAIRIRATIHHDNVENMSELVLFCNEYQIPFISFAPICDFGDAKINSIKQPDIGDYVENMKAALLYAEKYAINIDLKGRSYFDKLSQHRMKVPFVWLPDGKLAMSITYASSKLPGADTIIIGEYDTEMLAIVIDSTKLKKMNSNFIKNRKKYCKGCPLLEKCQGIIHVTPFLTDTFIEERDRYFCNMAIAMNKAFPC